MKYGSTEIKDMLDIELVQACLNMNNAEARRQRASNHEKFNTDREIDGKLVKKMEFPPINPEFLKLKDALFNELNNRKLKLEISND